MQHTSQHLIFPQNYICGFLWCLYVYGMHVIMCIWRADIDSRHLSTMCIQAKCLIYSETHSSSQPKQPSCSKSCLSLPPMDCIVNRLPWPPGLLWTLWMQTHVLGLCCSSLITKSVLSLKIINMSNHFGYFTCPYIASQKVGEYSGR